MMIPPWHCLLFLSIVSKRLQSTKSFQIQSLTFRPRKGFTMHQATQQPRELCSKNENEASTASGEDNVSLPSLSTPSSPPAYRLKIVGLCGSTGSGKSFASSLLVSKINSALNDPSDENTNLYAHHIDTDSLGHGVYAPGSAALKEIETEFGKDIITQDGMVNRKALGRIVFADRNEMSKLEHIVWPHLKDLLLKRLMDIQSSYDQGTVGVFKAESRIVVVEAAILLDTNWDADDLFDAIWVVKASPQTSTKRLVENRGLEENDALKRIEAQSSRRGMGNLEEELRNGAVTAVIENNGEGEEILWENMKAVLMDQKCWKVDRCPTLDREALERK